MDISGLSSDDNKMCRKSNTEQNKYEHQQYTINVNYMGATILIQQQQQNNILVHQIKI